MKKFCLFVLLFGMIVSLAACGKVEITMQEIYDAGQNEAMLKNHQIVYIRDEMDGELFNEIYMTEEYVYDYVPDEESDWAEFMTDDVCYCYMGGDYVRYLPITPDGVSDGFASYRAEHYASVILGVGTVDDTIESVSKKDGRITVKSVLSSKNLEALAEDGVAAGKFEYVLDAKTREIISVISDYTYDDGTAFRAVAEVTYDAEAPENGQDIFEIR